MKKIRLFRRKPTKEATISAVVIRADGTREDLGVISRGPVKFTPKGDARAR